MHHSLDRLSKRLKTLQDITNDGVKPILVFDKDDVDTLDFVTASANLRATIFSIDPKSKFDTKRKSPNATSIGTARLTCDRDGWQHYPGDCYVECHDCWSLCSASV